MKELRERIEVACPAGEAEEGLLAFFSAREDVDGMTRMRLRVPIAGSNLSLEREVRVEARRSRDDENLNDLVHVSWQAENAVVFPRFEGALIAWGDGSPETSFVELRGTYTPPLGVAGQLFDDAIGYQIAQATAQQFLRDVKRDIEGRQRR